MMYHLLTEMKQPKAALDELAAAMRENPKDPEPYAIRGEIALHERRIDYAKMDFDPAKKLLADFPKAERKPSVAVVTYCGLASAAEAVGDWADASDATREYLKIMPEDSIGFNDSLAHFSARAIQRRSGIFSSISPNLSIARLQRNTAHRTLSCLWDRSLAKWHDHFLNEKPAGDVELKWFEAALKAAPNDFPSRVVIGFWAMEW